MAGATKRSGHAGKCVCQRHLMLLARIACVPHGGTPRPGAHVRVCAVAECVADGSCDSGSSSAATGAARYTPREPHARAARVAHTRRARTRTQAHTRTSNQARMPRTLRARSLPTEVATAAAASLPPGLRTTWRASHTRCRTRHAPARRHTRTTAHTLSESHGGHCILMKRTRALCVSDHKRTY